MCPDERGGRRLPSLPSRPASSGRASSAPTNVEAAPSPLSLGPCFIRTGFICPDERGGRHLPSLPSRPASSGRASSAPTNVEAAPSPLSLGPSPGCRHLCSLAVLEPRADRLGDTVFWKVDLAFDKSRSVEHWPLAAAFTGGSVTVAVINSICTVCLHSTRV